MTVRVGPVSTVQYASPSPTSTRATCTRAVAPHASDMLRTVGGRSDLLAGSEAYGGCRSSRRPRHPCVASPKLGRRGIRRSVPRFSVSPDRRNRHRADSSAVRRPLLRRRLWRVPYGVRVRDFSGGGSSDTPADLVRRRQHQRSPRPASGGSSTGAAMQHSASQRAASVSDSNPSAHGRCPCAPSECACMT